VSVLAVLAFHILAVVGLCLDGSVVDGLGLGPLDWTSTPSVSYSKEGNMCCFVAVPKKGQTIGVHSAFLAREFDIVPSKTTSKRSIFRSESAGGLPGQVAPDIYIREEDLPRFGDDLQLLMQCSLPQTDAQPAAANQAVLGRSKFTLRHRDSSASRLRSESRSSSRPGSQGSSRSSTSHVSIQRSFQKAASALRDATPPPRAPSASPEPLWVGPRCARRRAELLARSRSQPALWLP